MLFLTAARRSECTVNCHSTGIQHLLDLQAAHGELESRVQDLGAQLEEAQAAATTTGDCSHSPDMCL